MTQAKVKLFPDPAKASITKLPKPTRAGSWWRVQLPGYYWADGFSTFEKARQFVADWVDGRVR